MDERTHENMAWLDLETTGLDPNENVILEIAIIITTPNLEVVAEASWVVRHLLRDIVIDTLMDDFVRNMHNDSGLIDEMRKGSEYLLDLPIIENEAMEFVEAYNAKGSPLCGNTIGFDRGFLKQYAPKLNDMFHYRIVDVSTLKNVLRLHYPDQEPWQPPENKAHRALDDLRCSIEEYKHYLTIFSKGAGRNNV